ncbi:MAG: thymidylate synthase, partial [Parcubacteria group bacterium]|nr:thymidylate synthase [Parcubacteria group bacterium]
MTQFDLQYQLMLGRILKEGYTVYNERTGHELKSLPGMTFELEVGREFPLLTLRKAPLKLFIAEQIWFITGSNRPDFFLREFTHIWDDFIEEDGTVRAAYGYRWRKHFGRDQLGQLIAHLQDNPGSRHGVVMMWDPADDGLGAGTAKKNVPCPYTFTANILGEKLHLHLIIRSNDMMLGNPHDVAGFALLQCLLAAKLNLKPGKLTVSISNAHIYDIHYEQAREIITRSHEHPPILFESKPDYFDRAEKADKTLVYELEDILSQQYHPLPPIKGL